MTHKASELTGALLDRAVAIAAGVDHEADTTPRDPLLAFQVPAQGKRYLYRPSQDWMAGGPIIERERIELLPVCLGRWVASASGTEFNETGPTPLIAAMRAYVASKFGEGVELPDNR